MSKRSKKVTVASNEYTPTAEQVTYAGAIYTPMWLAEYLCEFISPERITDNTVFLDPCCGSGNLLVALAKYLLTLGYTGAWVGSRLRGYDIDQIALDVANSRLAEVLGLETYNLLPLGDQEQCDVVVVMNPPYQKPSNEVGKPKKGAPSAYPEWVLRYANEPRASLAISIIPAKYIRGGGKGGKNLQEFVVNSPHVTHITEFPRTPDVFPTVRMAGGIQVLVIDKNQDNKGMVKVSYNREHWFDANLKKYGILIRGGEDSHELFEYLNNRNLASGCSYVGSMAQPRSYYGVASNVEGRVEPDEEHTVRCLTKFGKWLYIRPEQAKRLGRQPNHAVATAKLTGSNLHHDHALRKNNVCLADVSGGLHYDHIGFNRVSLSKTNGAAHNHSGVDLALRVFSKSHLLRPGEICSETYFIVNSFETEEEAKYFQSYLYTKLVRFLVFVTASHVHIGMKNFCFVPNLPKYDRFYTDDYLYELYNLSPEQIATINKYIRD